MRPLAVALFCASVALAADAPPAPGTLEETSLRQLAAVRRVYVDRLTGGETAAQMRDILISAMEGARLFVLTENPDRADAVLRGAAEDLVFTDVFQSSEGISAHMNAGTGRTSSKTSGPYGGVGVGDNDSEHTSERRHEALAAVRLVGKDGDVIWATTQESLGARFRGASADVAEKIAARLKEDFDKARKLKTP